MMWVQMWSNIINKKVWWMDLVQDAHRHVGGLKGYDTRLLYRGFALLKSEY